MRTAIARSLAVVAVAAVAVAGGACSASRETAPGVGAGAGTPESPAATESIDVTATMETLKSLPLSEGREDLVFQYVRAGGIAALKSRFGEPTPYTTFSGDEAGGYCEFSDGRIYRFQYGWDSTGKAVVMCHVVEASADQTETAADRRFAVEVVDGRTTLEDANRYLAATGVATVTPAAPDSTSRKVPAYAWYQPDGTGFLVVDLTALDASQRATAGLDEDSGPYQGLYWDITHWRAY